jgi:hypothetical protein
MTEPELTPELARRIFGRTPDPESDSQGGDQAPADRPPATEPGAASPPASEPEQGTDPYAEVREFYRRVFSPKVDAETESAFWRAVHAGEEGERERHDRASRRRPLPGCGCSRTRRPRSRTAARASPLRRRSENGATDPEGPVRLARGLPGSRRLDQH